MIERGEICVMRKAWIDGQCEELVMPLNNQAQYQEWNGCFSWVGDNDE
jgi:hypothetical protein